VGEGKSSAHGESPDGDGTEFESVKALRWVNKKGYGRRKTGTYRGLVRARGSKDPVTQQSKPTPSTNDKVLYAHFMEVVVYEILQINLAGGGRRSKCCRSFDGTDIGKCGNVVARVDIL
jgi:hypothetical protein